MRRLLLVPSVSLLVIGAPVLALGTPPTPAPIVTRVPVLGLGAQAGPGFRGQAAVTANTIGVTWDGDPHATFELGVHRDSGEWVAAGPTSAADFVPDPGSPDAARAAAIAPYHASEPIWTGPVNEVQVSLTSGSAENVKIVAVTDPPAAPTGSAGALGFERRLSPTRHRFGFAVALLVLASVLFAVALGWKPRRSRRGWLPIVCVGTLMLVACRPVPPPPPPPSTSVPQPAIISRAAWGAQPFSCAGGPQYTPPLLFAVVHHTVDSNNYTPDQSATLVRNIQAYHQVTLGYCDIAYNFLVDRFGQVFEGRDGGITNVVLAAHTGGFNSHSTGVAVIGTFTDASTLVPAAGWNSLVQLLRWKLSLHHVNPLVPFTTVSNGGGSYWPAGTVVTLPRSLVGHRDLWPTECPGDGIWNNLDPLRQQVAAGLP
jgi:hypothetical protein